MRYLLIIILCFAFLGCEQKSPEVVVYTSVDKIYASRIFDQFEKDTGIKVKPVYDTEATKGIGLTKRLLMEKSKPKADIFWNSEQLRTALLTKKNIFIPLPHLNPSYKKTSYKNSKGYWFGFGVRYRTIVTKKEDNIISPGITLEDVIKKTPSGKFALAKPYAGSTTTHFVALHSRLGDEKFTKFLTLLIKKKVRFLAGNSLVMESVASLKDWRGLTDSDDVTNGQRNGRDIRAICYTDLPKKGAFELFGTLSIIRNAPHPKEAEIFLRYMLKSQQEYLFIKMGAVNAGTLQGTPSPKCSTWNIPLEKMVEKYPQTILMIQKELNF